MNKLLAVWVQLSKRILLLVGLFLLLWALPDFSNGKQECCDFDSNFTDIVTAEEILSDNDTEIGLQQLQEASQELQKEARKAKETRHELTERKVEKLNAAIEEQIFLSEQQLLLSQDQVSTNRSFEKIEENLLAIEKIAQQEGVSHLVDYPSINLIRRKIALYQQNSALS